MINLLPPDAKKDLLYSRRNTVLAQWMSACTLALVGVGIIVAAGYLYLNHSINNYTKQVETAKLSLQTQKVDETQKKIESISNDTKLAIQVLSREILFSKLLKQLGAALPANTTLQQFQIDKFQGGLTLRGAAKDINSATQLQVNLQDPNNKIFEKADIENITCTAPSPDTPYPCAVQIRALFNKNNPFLFISPTTQSTGAKQQ